ncbi:MAG: hypothetical protein ISR48_00385 [Alphaproteobacteria bacterium]|nr:hypothetical protein [Alphaproteobacteria bacterium]
MIEFRDLAPCHLNKLVEAHLTTWSGNDLSVRLGEGFVRRFYELAIEDTTSFAVGAGTSENEELSCWCLGFTCYEDFNSRLKKSLGLGFYFLVLGRMLTGRLPLGQIADQFLRPKPYRKAQCPDAHLGAFGCFEEGMEAVLTLSSLIGHVAERLGESHPACWSVTAKDNRGADMVMKRAGFKVIDAIRLSGSETVIYEYTSR